MISHPLKGKVFKISCEIYDCTNTKGTYNLTGSGNNNDEYIIFYQNNKVYQKTFDEENVTVISLIMFMSTRTQSCSGY